jgi:hypothetical protein
MVPEVASDRAVGYCEAKIRGDRLRGVNFLLLAGIVVVLAGAAAFIVFAGQIAGKDTQALDSMRTLRVSMADEAEGLSKLQLSSETETIARAAAMRDLTEKNLTDAGRRNAQRQVDESTVKLKTLSDRIAETQAALARHQKLVAEIEERFYLSDAAPKDAVTATNLLVAAGVTRFGVLVVVIYLVQILVGLYRYNAQLSSHYFAQADALLLYDCSPGQMGDLLSKLRPGVAFSRVEASVPEKMVNKIVEAVRAAGMKASPKGE